MATGHCCLSDPKLFVDLASRMAKIARMRVDWNPIVHILDELSEGTHSLHELSYAVSQYEPGAYLESLLFLANRHLIELSEGVERLTPIAQPDWPQRLREAFATEGVAKGLLARTSIDLTDRGEQVLRLLNVGHPPFSRSESGN